MKDKARLKHIRQKRKINDVMNTIERIEWNGAGYILWSKIMKTDKRSTKSYLRDEKRRSNRQLR